MTDAQHLLQPIGDEAFGQAYERVHAAAESAVRDGSLPHLPSFFPEKTLTAMAFVAFAEAGGRDRCA